MNIHIEFCEKWDYNPEFERVSNIIKQQYPNIKIKGNSIPPRSGSFEVTLDDKLIYSKFKTNSFPDKNEILGWFNNFNHN